MYGVYIVDDEPLMLNSIINAIAWQENGFEVIGSNTNPRVAASEIIAMKPQLVFCDLKMPDMDGISLIKHLRDQGIASEFVMLSAYGEFEASRSFFLLDGFDYLLKPLRRQEAEIVLERLSRRLTENENMKPSTTFKQTNTKAFDDMVDYISQNFQKKFTLEKLSAQFNISPSYICSLFSKHYQSSLTVFLTTLRMKEAARLITETDMAFKEVAVICGYSDYFYFCRVFKGYHGVSPTEHRQRT